MIIIEEGERCGDKENKQQGATTWETDNCDSQWRQKGETTDSPIQLNFAKQKWQPNHLIIALKSFGVTHLPLLVLRSIQQNFSLLSAQTITFSFFSCF